ncbi:hypothetical protein OWV82_004482 [Melia azedarach]|uniref:Uncharacterized protein n=3 Tax=Melia azedarach TaxID=155640 RepID=A0ACC1XMF0_MELAZ|nr:hypothetical protein OWV82_014849 [Melia azedarach]KAJ4717235.1 hypothetical protein OWV82_012147 [Melia azedarach]KAJ4725643.1 hypothetical protein OWV82_004482 [Melia azedarach]
MCLCVAASPLAPRRPVTPSPTGMLDALVKLRLEDLSSALVGWRGQLHTLAEVIPAVSVTCLDIPLHYQALESKYHLPCAATSKSPLPAQPRKSTKLGCPYESSRSAPCVASPHHEFLTPVLRNPFNIILSRNSSMTSTMASVMRRKLAESTLDTHCINLHFTLTRSIIEEV